MRGTANPFGLTVVKTRSRTGSAYYGRDTLTPEAHRGEVAGERVEQVRGGLVPGKRPAVRIGHVVGWAGAEQLAALAAGAGPRQPVAERLARGARARLAAAPEQSAEREGAGPALGQQYHRVPGMLPGQAEYEV